MATAYAFLAVNMDNLYFDGGDVRTATSSHIQIANGIYLENYYGSFTYSNNEIAGGVVTSYNIYKNGSKLASITGLSHSALKWDSYETVSSLHAFVFSGNDTLNGSSYDDVLRSYAGNDVIYGNGGKDDLYGGAGNDTIDGGPGVDSMTGGLGNDTYSVNTAGDKTIENSGTGTGIDTVKSSITWTLGANIENLILTGTTAISGTGNTLANTMTGNTAANSLSGLGGNDTLIGGAGNDILDGGTGVDSMTGGLGNDTYFVNSASDKTVENSGTGTGTDTVKSNITWTLGANVENLILTGTIAINGAGNALANTMTGNTAANSLSGLGGNDTLIGGAGNDILDGGTGVDSMTGGLGNDTYFINTTGDKTIENSGTGTGIDTVKSSITWTLGANVENLMLTGTTAINGTGNTLANTITGNGGANILSGGTGADKLVGNGGADILKGGTGSDTLTGGAGHDVFLFNTTLGASNVDRISDFVTSDDTIHDTIQLSRATFTQLTISSSLNLGRFRSSTDGSAADTNDYILYNTTTGALFYDADGSGKGVAVQFATLSNKPQKVTAADFEVVA